MTYLKLNDITAYKTAFGLSNYIWECISKWNYFEQDTVGKQLVRACDSISANIAEGFGRYGKRDKVKFYYYAKGSVWEALDWNEKCKKRALITEEQYQHILGELQELPKAINSLIKFTNERLQH